MFAIGNQEMFEKIENDRVNFEEEKYKGKNQRENKEKLNS